MYLVSALFVPLTICTVSYVDSLYHGLFTSQTTHTIHHSYQTFRTTDYSYLIQYSGQLRPGTQSLDLHELVLPRRTENLMNKPSPSPVWNSLLQVVWDLSLSEWQMIFKKFSDNHGTCDLKHVPLKQILLMLLLLDIHIHSTGKLSIIKNHL